MKIKNSTTWPAWFLRRVVSWCCRELDLPVHVVRGATFRNSKSAWGGCARYWKGITVCVGHAGHFPAKAVRGSSFQDREDCLVHVTAHELSHIAQYNERSKTRGGGGWGGSENSTEHAYAIPVFEKFQAQRSTLLAKWWTPPAVALRPQLSLVEKRSRKAHADLARWQRKLKIAQTKVRALRRRVNYYDKNEKK